MDIIFKAKFKSDLTNNDVNVTIQVSNLTDFIQANGDAEMAIFRLDNCSADWILKKELFDFQIDYLATGKVSLAANAGIK